MESAAQSLVETSINGLIASHEETYDESLNSWDEISKQLKKELTELGIHKMHQADFIQNLQTSLQSKQKLMDFLLNKTEFNENKKKFSQQL